jgi:hypothetical protein
MGPFSQADRGQPCRLGLLDQSSVIGVGVGIGIDGNHDLTNSWPPISDLFAPPSPKKFMDQGISPTHPHGQVYNATAPLRLCARLSESGWESLVGNANISPPTGIKKTPPPRPATGSPLSILHSEAGITPGNKPIQE